MSSEIAKTDEFAEIERVLVSGDLGRLTPNQRVMYYTRVCDSLGLNPMTRPFEFITLNGKLTLYARKDCTDQLRKIHGVSIRITGRELVDDLVVVTCEGTDKSGRTDSSIGAVSISGLKGEAKANAMMKAETKSRRRTTLALCGLGMLDESEIESIPNARVGEPLDKPADRIINRSALPSASTSAPAVVDDGFVKIDIKAIEEVKGKNGASVWKVTDSQESVFAVFDPMIVSDLADIRQNGTLARCEVQKRGDRHVILNVTEVSE